MQKGTRRRVINIAAAGSTTGAKPASPANTMPTQAAEVKRCAALRSKGWDSESGAFRKPRAGTKPAPPVMRIADPAPDGDPVSYNSRRPEKWNINEDPDSLHRLRHGFCCVARGLHGWLQKFGCVRAVDAKQAGRHVVGYVAGRPSRRCHPRLAGGDRRFDRACDHGVGSSGHGSFFRSGCGCGAGGFGVVVVVVVGGWLGVSGVSGFGHVAGLGGIGGRCGRRGCVGSSGNPGGVRGRACPCETSETKDRCHGSGRRMHVSRRGAGCFPLVGAGEVRDTG